MPEKEAESKQGRGSRKRSGNKGCYFLLILALIGLLAIITVFFVGIVYLKPKIAGNTLTPSLTSPTEDDEGVKWSHKELIGYLQKQGVVILAESTSYRASDGPAMFFFERTDPLDAYLKAVANGADRLYDGATVCTHFAHVSKVKSTQEAKDEAGVKADRAFSWGRFVFRGDPEYLARMKRVLP